MQEVNEKNAVIADLERRLSEEKRQRQLEMIEKGHKVEELEREISHTIESQIRENQELRERLADNSMLLQAYKEAESLVKQQITS